MNIYENSIKYIKSDQYIYKSNQHLKKIQPSIFDSWSATQSQLYLSAADKHPSAARDGESTAAVCIKHVKWYDLSHPSHGAARGCSLIGFGSSLCRPYWDCARPCFYAPSKPAALSRTPPTLIVDDGCDFELCQIPTVLNKLGILPESVSGDEI